MNETQLGYVEAVRIGGKSGQVVCEELEDLEPAAYGNAGFREMLFAIDSLNRIKSPEWRGVFIQGVIDHADWTENGRLISKAYMEIAEYQQLYGYGEYGMELVVDMFEVIDSKPVNATSFTRRTIRGFFNGVQPISDHVFFIIKRFFATRSPLSDDDIALLFHIREETKGLENSGGFDHFFVSNMMEWVMDSKDVANGLRAAKTFMNLESIDEITEAEKRLIRTMKEKAIGVPEQLLRHIDLSKDRLMGLA